MHFDVFHPTEESSLSSVNGNLGRLSVSLLPAGTFLYKAKTPTLFSILSKATNKLRSCMKYLRVLSDTVTFQDAIVLHLHHQENLFPHLLCARIHWTAAGVLGAQGEAEMSSSSKTIK